MNAGNARVWIALGSNLGDPRARLNEACLRLLEAGLMIEARSNLYRTRPWGVADQPEFLNAAIAARTSLAPHKLLALCKRIEAEMGRIARRRWGEREIDLDILMMEGWSIHSPELTLPHPGLAHRDFVIAPLADLGAPLPALMGEVDWGTVLERIPEGERCVIDDEEWKS